MKIDVAIREDMPKVMELVINVFLKQDIPGELNYIPEEKRPKWWVIRSKQDIIGALALFIEDGKYHLGRLVIKEEERGKNLATKLVKEALDQIFLNDIDIIYMDARDITVKIMLKLGAKIVGDPRPFYKGLITPMVIKKEDYLSSNI